MGILEQAFLLAGEGMQQRCLSTVTVEWRTQVVRVDTQQMLSPSTISECQHFCPAPAPAEVFPQYCICQTYCGATMQSRLYLVRPLIRVFTLTVLPILFSPVTLKHVLHAAGLSLLFISCSFVFC